MAGLRCTVTSVMRRDCVPARTRPSPSAASATVTLLLLALALLCCSVHAQENSTFEAIGSAPFPARSSHCATSNGVQLRVIGGLASLLNPLTPLADVWTLTRNLGAPSLPPAWSQATNAANFAPRFDHACTHVDGGKFVVITGGQGAGGAGFNDLWFLDANLPATEPQSWVPVAVPLSAAQRWSKRWGHTLTVFQGRVVLTGGMALNGTSQYLASAEVWSVDEGELRYGQKWTQHAQAAWVPRAGHVAAVLGDKLAIYGGHGDSIDAPMADLYVTSDLDSLWILLGQSPFAARLGIAAAMFGSDLIFASGDEATDVWSLSDSRVWTLLSSTAPYTPRVRASLTEFEGKLLLLAGMTDLSLGVSTNEVFRTVGTAVAQPSFAPLAGTPTFSGRFGHVAASCGGKLWIASGTNHTAGPFNDAHVWESRTALWRQVTASAPWIARRSAALVPLSGGTSTTGSALFFGGIVDCALETWKALPAAPWTPRYQFAAALWGDAVALLGGFDAVGLVSDRFWLWRASTGWAVQAIPPWSARARPVAAVMGGALYLHSGSLNGVLLTDTYRLSTEGGAWQQLASITGYGPAPIAYLTMAPFGGDLVVTGATAQVWRLDSDSLQWALVRADSTLGARVGSQMVNHDSRLVLVAGTSADTGADLADAWTSAQPAAAQLGPSFTLAAALPFSQAGGAAVECAGITYLLGAFPGSYPGHDESASVYALDDDWIPMQVASWSPRYAHAAFVIDDSTAFVSGGTANGIYLADIWSAPCGSTTTLTWAKLSTGMPTERAQHATVVWRDYVFAIGGRISDTALASDVVLVRNSPGFVGNSWSAPSIPGTPLSPRAYPTVAVIGDALVVIGGSDNLNNLNDAYILTQPHGTAWIVLGAASAAPFPPIIQPAAAIWDRRLVIAGGQGTLDYQSTVYTLDSDFRWSMTSLVAPFPGRSRAVMVNHRGRLRLIGGMSSSVPSLGDEWVSELESPLSTAEPAFELQSAIPQGGTAEAALVSLNGAAYLLGGMVEGVISDAVYRYRDNGGWQDISGPGGFSARSYLAAVAAGGSIIVAGGLNGGTALADVWQMTFNSQGQEQWARLADGEWPPRFAHMLLQWNDDLVVAAGSNFSGQRNDVWSSKLSAFGNLSPWTNHGTAVAPWPTRDSAVAGVVGRALIVTGGAGRTGVVNDCWPVALFSWDAQWMQLPAAPFTLRLAMMSAMWGSSLLVAGGVQNGGYRNDVFLLSETATGFEWSLVTDAAAFSPRKYAAMTAFEGKIMLAGGLDSFGLGRNDVYLTTTVAPPAATPTWNPAFAPASLPSSPAPWQPTTGMAALSCGGRLWSIAGYDFNGGAATSNVYALQDLVDAGDQPQWLSETAVFSARYGHAAVTDGTTILLTGGLVGSGGAADIWRRSCSSPLDGGGWTLATDYANWPARFQHQAVLWGENVVILGGASGANFFNDLFAAPFDSAALGGVWQKQLDAPWSPRQLFAASVMADRLYITGGIDATTVTQADMWRLDHIGGPWTNLTNAPFGGRFGLASTLLGSTLIFLGGRTATQSFNDVWRFNDMERWTLITPRGAFRPAQQSIVAAHNERLFILGSTTVDQSLTNDVSTSLAAPAATPDFDLQGILQGAGRPGKRTISCLGKLILLGGYGPSGAPQPGQFRVIESLDASVTPRPGLNPLPALQRNYFSATKINSHEAFLVGGIALGSLQPGDAWTLDCATEAWRNAATPTATAARWGHSAVMFQGALVLLGGISSGSATNSVWSLGLNAAASNVDSAVWSQRTAAASWAPRAHFIAEVLNGALFVSCGIDPARFAFNDLHRLRSLNGAWEQLTGAAQQPPFPPRWGQSHAIWNNALIVTTGAADSNDVYQLSDSLVWTLITSGAPYSPRLDASLSVYQDHLVLIQGRDSSRAGMTDWFTSSVPPSAPVLMPTFSPHPGPMPASFTSRTAGAAAVCRGSLYYSGGRQGANAVNEVLRLSGADWTVLPVQTAWAPRQWHVMVSASPAQNVLWLSTGQGDGGTWRPGQFRGVCNADGSLTWVQLTGQAGNPAVTQRWGAAAVYWRGFIVVLGGMTPNGASNDAFAIDAASIASGTSGGAWVPLASTVGWSPRHSLTAAVLADALFVFGGQQSTPYTLLADLWCLTALGSSWSALSSTSPLTPRGMASSAVWGGALLVLAGNSGNASDPLSDAWRFDGRQWTLLRSSGIFSPRYSATLTNYNGRLIAVGGEIAGNPLSDVMWSDAEPTVPACAAEPCLAPAAAGGFAPMYSAAANAQCAGKWYLLGGFTQTGVTNQVASFTPASGVWNVLSGIPWSGRSRAAAVSVISADLTESVLLLGGRVAANSYPQEVWSLACATGVWSPLATPAWSGRHNHRAVAWQGNVVMVGGQNSQGNVLQEVWSLSLANLTGDWTAQLAMKVPEGRSDASVAVLDGKLFVVGGLNPMSYSTRTVYMSPALGSPFVRLADAPYAARGNAMSAVLGATTLVIAGGLSQGLDGANLNDAWRMSSSGHWSRMTDAAAFSPRVGGSMTELPGGRLALAGGLWSAGSFFFNDVFLSGVPPAPFFSLHPAQPPATFAARAGVGLLTCPTGLLAVGGYSGDFTSAFNDVHRLVSNANGTSHAWSRVTDAAAFPQRVTASYAVLPSGALMAAGGSVPGGGVTNAVWLSSCAGPATWLQPSKPNADWSPREGAALLVWKNSLIIIAGVNGLTFFNDCWTISIDALSANVWQQVVSISGVSFVPPFEPRFGHTAAIVNDALVVVGGTAANGVGGDLPEVWMQLSPTFAQAWQQLTPPPFSARRWMASAVSQDRLYIASGVGTDALGTSFEATQDVWTMQADFSWSFSVVTQQAVFSPRWRASMAVYQNRLLMLAGNDLTTDSAQLFWSADQSPVPPPPTPASSSSSSSSTGAAGAPSSTGASTGPSGPQPAFSLHPSSPVPFAGRMFASAAVCGSGLYVLGGVGSSSYNDVFVLSGAGAGVWRSVTVAAPFSRRFGAAAVTVGPSTLLLLGGEAGGQPTSDVWALRCDAASQQNPISRITQAAPWQPRTGHQAVIFQSRLLVMSGFGGATVGAASIGSDVWSVSAADIGSSQSSVASSAQWIRESDAAWPARWYFISAVVGPSLFVTGGDGAASGFTFSDLWRLDSVSDFSSRGGWLQLPSAPIQFAPMHGAAYTVWSGRLLLVAGSDSSGRRSRVAFEFDGSNWLSVASVPETFRPRYGAALAEWQQRAILIGGSTANAVFGNDAWWTQPRAQQNVSVWTPPVQSSSSTAGGPALVSSSSSTAAATPSALSSSSSSTATADSTAAAVSSSSSTADASSAAPGSSSADGGSSAAAGVSSSSTAPGATSSGSSTASTSSTGASSSGGAVTPVPPTAQPSSTAAVTPSSSSSTGSASPAAVPIFTLHPSSPAPFAGRMFASAAVCGSGLYVLGGVGSSSYNDVFVLSGAGAGVWRSVSAAAPFSRRFGAAAVSVGPSTLLLLGGEAGGQPSSDVWALRCDAASQQNPTAATFSRITQAAPWQPRTGHQAVIFQSRLLVMSGFGGTAAAANIGSDVWSVSAADIGSSDSSVSGSARWQREADAAWPARFYFVAAVLSQSLYVALGSSAASPDPLRDLWRLSAIGTSWTALDAAPLTRAGVGVAAAVWSGLIVCAGGRDADGVSSAEVSTFDGTQWAGSVDSSANRRSLSAAQRSLLQSASSFSARFGASLVLFEDRLILLAGSDAAQNFSDVWESQQQAAAAGGGGETGAADTSNSTSVSPVLIIGITAALIALCAAVAIGLRCRSNHLLSTRGQQLDGTALQATDFDADLQLSPLHMQRESFTLPSARGSVMHTAVSEEKADGQ